MLRALGSEDMWYAAQFTAAGPVQAAGTAGAALVNAEARSCT